MADTLPVREMVLYKHGVGFFVRGGEVEGQNLALTFRHDEINDVLKSLAVFDRAGGQVLGVHYQTPMDKAVRLSYTSIRLSDQASLRDLLRDLRGRRVTVEIETTLGGMERLTGRMIGLDQHVPKQAQADIDPTQSARVTLLLESGEIRAFSFVALRGLTIHDSQSGHDLTYFLDTSMDEDSLRTVNVRLSEGKHDLAVYYVAPSPTWRVSYRLVAEADEDGSGTGKALLQGWGLFDNRLEEDLNDVRVTLVAGQPISFIYDLYASHIPERPIVEDDARVVSAPPEFRAARAPRVQADKKSVADERSDWDATMVSPSFLPSAYRPNELARSTLMSVESKDTGETFQYQVGTPVTVKRGESALVPILGTQMNYERELLYNWWKLQDHPVVALRLTNTSGLTLERGPITVVEDGDYKGEAILPFTKDGGQIYIPFAVELGIQISQEIVSSEESSALRIENAYYIYEKYDIVTTQYRIENSTNRDVSVTIEAPIHPNLTLFNTPTPHEQTLGERRWRVPVGAGQIAEFARHERNLSEQREKLVSLKFHRLHQFFQQNILSEALYAQLNSLVNILSQIQKAKQRQERLNTDREALYKQQEQLRANLGALHTAGKEAALRERLLGQLETAQDKIDAIDREIEEITQQIEAANAKIEEIIAALAEQ